MRLHLHVRERGQFSEDEQGAEFASLDEARKEALASAREMLAERIVTARPVNGISFEIADERGNVVLTLPWDDALVRM